MKKMNYLLLGIAAVGLFIVSCSKDGATGPEGPSGVQGALGPAGPAGTNGKSGSIIYSGTTDPASALGTVGDFYLNISTGLLYGPKTAAGWGSGFSLKGTNGATGATGATGAAGSKTLSGSGAPGAATGILGDYYLDKTNYLLYGPKIAAGWGPAVSLQGPAGTANVQYSGWLYATNFRDTTADNSALKAGDLIAPALTQSALNSATFQIYFTFGGGVYTLPYTSNAGGKQNTISFWPRLGHFVITRFTSDNSNDVALSTLLQYRYIIIPGGKQVASAKNVDINNYESVRKFYRIPD